MKSRILFIAALLFIKINSSKQDKINTKKQKIIEYYNKIESTILDRTKQKNITIENFINRLIQLLKPLKEVEDKIKNISEENFIINHEITDLIISSKLHNDQKEDLITELCSIKKSLHKKTLDKKRITYLKNTKNISGTKLYYIMQIEILEKKLLSTLLKLWCDKESSIQTTMHPNSNKLYIHQEINELNNDALNNLNLIKNIFFKNSDKLMLLQDLIVSSINSYSQYFVYANDSTKFTCYNTNYTFPNIIPNAIFHSKIFQNSYNQNTKKFIPYTSKTSIEIQKQEKNSSSLDKIRENYDHNNQIMDEIYINSLKELNKTIRYPVNTQFSSKNEAMLQNLIQNFFQQIVEEFIEKKCENLEEEEDFFDLLCLMDNNFEHPIIHDSLLNNSESIETKLNLEKDYMHIKLKYNELNKTISQKNEKIKKLTNVNNSKTKDLLVVSAMICTVFIAWLFFNPKEESQTTDSKI